MNETKIDNYSSIPWLKIFDQTFEQPSYFPGLLTSFGIGVKELSLIAKKSTDESEAYGRKVLFQNSEIEVMLACWSYKAMASPHNHGASKGMIWFAKGNFSEQHYRFQNGVLRKVSSPVLFKENEVVTVDANDIHSCCPESIGLSLHIYSPPIHHMKVWDQEKKRTLTVENHCGAWVPKNKNLILQEVPW